MRQAAVLVLVGALALTAVSCGSGISVVAGADGEPGGRGINGTWVLQRLSEGGVDVDLPDGLELRIDADQVWGDSACNSFSGGVRVGDNGAFTATDLAQTEMACVDGDLMALDSVHPSAVAFATAWSIEGPVDSPTHLTLTGPDAVVTYTRAAPPPNLPLEGTIWTLDTIYSGSGASGTASSTDQNTAEATIEIVDGSLTLRSGACETVVPVTSLVDRERSLLFPPIQPPSDCSSNYVAAAEALMQTVQYEIVESRLTLSSVDGDLIGFRARR